MRASPLRTDAFVRLPILALAFGALTACSPPVASDAGDTGGDALDDLADAPAETGMDAQADSAPADVMPDYLRPPDVTRTMPESAMITRRQNCEFQSGAWPAETLGTDSPVGEDIPIDHILVLMMENRSFDHYYSHLPESGQTDVEVPPAGWTNHRADGSPVAPMHDTQYCWRDLDHEWHGTHDEWNNGAMDGFVVANDPMGERALAYETQADIPFYYGLANTFAIADHYFCGTLGPTFPNRLYMLAATSFGLTYNTPVVADTAAHPVNQIFLRLDAAGVDWKDYAAGVRTPALFVNYGILRRATQSHLVGVDQLMTDLASGNLPPFAFIEPAFSGTGGERADEHPPGTPQAGEAWVEPIVRAFMASPQWSRSALFITYDEHGGFADHVPPPPACAPDDLQPIEPNPDGGASISAGHAFDRYGVRVPFMVISPYARPHYVSHQVYDHTSILRFVEARFGLPAMTRRDANATPITDLFDFSHPSFATPPTNLPAAHGVPMALRDSCNAMFPNSGGL